MRFAGTATCEATTGPVSHWVTGHRWNIVNNYLTLILRFVALQIRIHVNSYNRLTILLIVLAILLIPACKRIAEVYRDSEDRLLNYAIYYDPYFIHGVDIAFISTTPESVLRHLSEYNRIDIKDPIQLEIIKRFPPEGEGFFKNPDVAFMVVYEYQSHRDTLFLTGLLSPPEETAMATTTDGINYSADSLYKYTFNTVIERDSLWQERVKTRYDMLRDLIDPITKKWIIE